MQNSTQQLFVGSHPICNCVQHIEIILYHSCVECDPFMFNVVYVEGMIF
jgi:hypothetical protein